MDDQTLHLIDLALQEDGADHDVSTLWTVPKDATAQGALLSRQSGVLCGGELFTSVFHRLDPEIQIHFQVEDGASISPNQTIAAISGKAHPILAGERLALNFIGRLSGVASETARYVKAIEGTPAKIADTRKTTPLWRKWEKYAVVCGGGVNHRMSLSDMALLKDNHLALAGGPAKAWNAAVEANKEALEIEVEVDTLDQLREALGQGAKRVLLDNMDPETLKKAVEINREQAILEASGGVSLESVKALAQSGVDLISVGALTHSVKCFDFSLAIYQDSLDNRR